MSKVAPYAKAVLGAVVAFLGSLGTVLIGDVGFGDITAGQWVAATIVGLTALGGIFAIPNKETK